MLVDVANRVGVKYSSLIGIYFGHLVYFSTWSTVLDSNPGGNLKTRRKSKDSRCTFEIEILYLNIVMRYAMPSCSSLYFDKF